MEERNFDEEVSPLKWELLRHRERRANLTLYMQFALSLLFVAAAIFLYYLAFSRSVDEVTIAASNAATFMFTALGGFWFTHRRRGEP